MEAFRARGVFEQEHSQSIVVQDQYARPVDARQPIEQWGSFERQQSQSIEQRKDKDNRNPLEQAQSIVQDQYARPVDSHQVDAAPSLHDADSVDAACSLPDTRPVDAAPSLHDADPVDAAPFLRDAGPVDAEIIQLTITSRLLLDSELQDMGADAFMLEYQKAQNILMDKDAADP